MTVVEYVKSRGMKMPLIIRETGVSRETLTNWYNNKRQLFDVVLLGVEKKLSF
jgi:AcrR family transcriptional regulator